MNTSQLECFVRVAETLSFQQAAETLHISQPAVSKQIASLEDELGARLFVRTTRTVALTPAGEVFLADARSILLLTYHARQMITESRQNSERTLRVGYSDANELFCLVRVFRALREKYADFTPLLVHNHWGHSNLSLVEKDQLDVCFAYEEDKHNAAVRFQPIAMEQLVCVLPQSHPLAGLSFIHAEQLRRERQVCVVPLPLRNRFYDPDDGSSFTVADDEKKITLCDNASEAYALVMAGFGYCVLPRYLAVNAPELRVIDCDIHPRWRHGVYYRGGQASPLLRRFLQQLQDV